MDDIQNFRAFIKTAETGSFSAAAREIGIAASVITKRVTQLEHRLRGQLFERTTRRVTLTALGERTLPLALKLVGEFDRSLSRLRDPHPFLEGHLRIKTPTTMSHLILGELFAEFQMLHAGISMDVFLIDRPVDPIEEGLDIAFGGASASFGNVIDIPFMPLEYVVCAAPAFIEEHGAPAHPRDLTRMRCLNFFPTGTVWHFHTPEGEISVNTSPVISSNDLTVILSAAVRGNGIAKLPRYVASQAIKRGDIVELLPGTSLEDIWIKALIPEGRLDYPPVEALIEFVRERLITALSESDDYQGL